MIKNAAHLLLKKSIARYKRGFNLIEVAMVLGVVGLVIGGIWVAAAAVNENMKVNDTAAGILTACDKATTVFPARMAPVGNYIQVPITTLISAKIFPESWIKNNNIIPPIGAIGATFWMDNSQGDQYTGEVRLNIQNMTSSQCLALLPKLSTTDSTIIRQLNVSGTGTVNISLPYTGSFTAACTSAAAITIQFRCTAR